MKGITIAKANPLRVEGDGWIDVKFKTADDMRAECWDRNQRCRRLDWTRWYFIRERDGQWSMDVAEGGHAEEVWAMMEDKPVVQPGLSSRETGKTHGLVRWKLRNGMTESAFLTWSTPAREEVRKAWISDHLRIAQERDPQNLPLPAVDDDDPW